MTNWQTLTHKEVMVRDRVGRTPEGFNNQPLYTESAAAARNPAAAVEYSSLGIRTACDLAR